MINLVREVKARQGNAAITDISNVFPVYISSKKELSISFCFIISSTIHKSFFCRCLKFRKVIYHVVYHVFFVKFILLVSGPVLKSQVEDLNNIILHFMHAFKTLTQI